MSMSLYASEADFWKAEAIRYATALVDFMDGTKDHDIQGETGLSSPDCLRIAEARRDAKALIQEQA